MPAGPTFDTELPAGPTAATVLPAGNSNIAELMLEDDEENELEDMLLDEKLETELTEL